MSTSTRDLDNQVNDFYMKLICHDSLESLANWCYITVKQVLNAIALFGKKVCHPALCTTVVFTYNGVDAINSKVKKCNQSRAGQGNICIQYAVLYSM